MMLYTFNIFKDTIFVSIYWHICNALLKKGIYSKYYKVYFFSLGLLEFKRYNGR